MRGRTFESLLILLVLHSARVISCEEESPSIKSTSDVNDDVDINNQCTSIDDEETECHLPENKLDNDKASISKQYADSEIHSCSQDKKCEESELQMLEQDESEHEPKDDVLTSEEQCKKLLQAKASGDQEATQMLMKLQDDQTNAGIDETSDTQIPEPPSCTEQNVPEVNSCNREDKDEIPKDEDAGHLQETEEADPDQENVPLREILLKLKPEGLTDDDDDQTSDYSATEASISDEIEEEALISSGSAEKQEADPDANATKTNGPISGSSSKKAVCAPGNTTEPVADVEIINATTLLKLLQVDPNVTGRTTAGPCHLVYFFSPYCPFSVVGSPYVNALARSLPNIPVYGLDSIEHHSVNARYGVMGTPTLLLFHNGNGVGRYNASDYSVAHLMSFVHHFTDQEITNINVTSLDFRAKLPSQIAEARPYILWAAWVFLLSCASWLFLTSELYARLTEAILNNWREAEAQNDHQD